MVNQIPALSKRRRVGGLLLIGIAGLGAFFSEFRTEEMYSSGWPVIALVMFVFSFGVGVFWGRKKRKEDPDDGIVEAVWRYVPYLMEFSCIMAIAQAIVGLGLSYYDAREIGAILRSPFLIVLAMGSGGALGFRIWQK